MGKLGAAGFSGLGAKGRAVDNRRMGRKQQSNRGGWTVNQKRLASALLLAHLAAVVAAPWSSPPPAPLVAERISAWFAPYQVAAYLNHGYRFFAPDPGPSHIIRYALTLPDGQLETGRIPDPERHQPRLLYHRFFMMTESLFNAWSRIEEIPPDAPIPAADRQLIEHRNNFARGLVQQLSQGIAQQLLEQRGAKSVRLFLEEHSIPYPEDVQQGRRLDDPELYSELAELGQYERAQE